MALVRDIIAELQALDLNDHIACPIWRVEDVLNTAVNDGKVITVEQAAEVIDLIHRKHDAELGITWITISCALEEYPSAADIECCNECGDSVAMGSGKFVNRIPDLNDVETRKEMGKPYPFGAWICADCDALTSDDV